MKNWYIFHYFILREVFVLKQRRSRLLLTVALTAIVLVIAGTTVHAEDLDANIQAALDAGDTAQAITMLQKAIGLDSRYHYNYYILGRIYYNQEQYEKAKKEFETALDKKGKHYESLYYLGLTQLQLGDIEGAKKSMSEGVKKAKDIKDWFQNGYGLVMMVQKNYDEAVKYFLQALIEEPDNAEYHINLGDAYFYQGVPPLAATEYEKAQNLDTAATEVYFHWAEACLEMRDYQCAIEKLKLVLSKDSTYAPAWRRAGQIYFKAALSSRTRDDRISRFREAIGSYKRYFELSDAPADSAHVRPYFEIGLAYANIYGFEEAAKYFEKVLAIPYVPKDIYFYYGKSLWGIREYVKAADALEKHLQWVSTQEDYHSNISDAEIYLMLGDSYYYRKPNDFTNAINYYKKSLEVDPEQKRALQNIAIAYHSLKSYSQAMGYYDKRIELGIDSSTASILKNAAFCALNLAGADEGGDEMLDDIIDAGSGPAPIEQAQVNPNVNYFEVAADYLNRYLEYYPNDDKVLLRIATVYLFNLSDCANGVKYFQRLLTVDPNNCDAKRSLGFAYFGGNICPKDYTKALNYLNDAYTCITASKGACDDVELILWIAQAYHLRAVDEKGSPREKADFKAANEWYHKCLKCEPNNQDCKDGMEQTSFEF